MFKFWRVFREKAGLKASPDQVTVRLHHKPAEKTQIDFCDGLWITEPLSGKKTLTQFFLGVLPFALLYLRGVCFGVHKANLYDPDVNPTYCDFANHMGLAVLAARPDKPKDKGFRGNLTSE